MAGFFTTNKRKMKTYILLKDLPDVKAGAKFELGRDADAYYLISDKTGTKYNCYCYPVDFVENNTEWFKEAVFTFIDFTHAGFDVDFKIRNPDYPVFHNFKINKERLVKILIAENKGELFIRTEESNIKRIKAVNCILSISYLSHEDKNKLLDMIDELS